MGVESNSRGGEIEALLSGKPPFPREVWERMKGWYQNSSDRVTPPSQVTFDKVTQEQADLYWRVSPPGEPLPILVYLVDVCNRSICICTQAEE